MRPVGTILSHWHLGRVCRWQNNSLALHMVVISHRSWMTQYYTIIHHPHYVLDRSEQCQTSIATSCLTSVPMEFWWGIWWQTWFTNYHHADMDWYCVIDTQHPCTMSGVGSTQSSHIEFYRMLASVQRLQIELIQSKVACYFQCRAEL
jgi:hypothetical protein